MFKRGDRVIWTERPGHPVRTGRVLNVMPNDHGLEDFHLYDVDFGSGLIKTLHGVNLRLAPEIIFACVEKSLLFEAFRKAAHLYSQLVSQLAEVAGSSVHAEFQLLSRKVKDARECSREARQQYEKHVAAHRC